MVFNEHVKRCVVSLDCFLLGLAPFRFSNSPRKKRKKGRTEEEEEALQIQNQRTAIMPSRRPEGNTKVVFTSWESLWDAIRETELSEDERVLVENTSVSGFVQSHNPRRQTYVFKNEEDYVPLNVDALTDATASIVGVDVYVNSGSYRLEMCLLIRYKKSRGGRGFRGTEERIHEQRFIKGGEDLPKVLRDCCGGSSVEDRVALIRRTRRAVARVELLRHTHRRNSKLVPTSLDCALRDLFFSDEMTSPFSPVHISSDIDDDENNSENANAAARKGVELDPLNGDDFIVTQFDRCKIDRTERRIGDETNVLVPWCVFNLRTLEEVWLSPGGFTRLCRYRRGEIYDVNDAVKRLHVMDERRVDSSFSSSSSSISMERRTRARFSFDFCSGSCKSAVHSLRRRRYVEWHERCIDNRGKVQMKRKRMKRVFICVDPEIESSAHKSAWADDQIFFLQAKVEDIRAVELIPTGIFRSIIAAPECRVYSRQRSSHDKKLRDELGDEEAEKILKMEILESNKQVRAIVDIANHLMVPCWIENPLGDRVHSLWNEYYPFMSFDYRIHKITYCAYGRKFQKLSAIMTNLGSIKLNPPCLGETKCEYKKLHDNHEEFCGYDGVPREISKLHPPSLVTSLDEQMEDDFYGWINEILFLR